MKLTKQSSTVVYNTRKSNNKLSLKFILHINQIDKQE